MVRGNVVLKIEEEDLDNGRVARLIREQKPSRLEVLGIKVQVRDTRDCPDVTQGHHVVARFFGNVLVPGRGDVVDCPEVTNAHVALTQAMDKSSLEYKPHIVDLGCGVGFLGTYLGKNFHLSKLIFSDLSANSLSLAERTYNLNSSISLTKNVEFRVGDASKTLRDLDGGIAVCAPYLIPEVCTVFPGVYSLFSNIAESQGLDLYIGHSNLSQRLIDIAAEGSGLKVKEVYRKRGVLLVPEYSSGRFPIQVEQARLGKLLPETVNILKPLGLGEDNGRYFHDIVVSRLSSRD
jgi:hypothetical protein